MLRVSIAAAIVCAHASFSHAGELPIARLAPDAAAYVTMQAAARAAITAALPLSIESEFGGVLMRCERGHYATEPVTSGNPRNVEYRARIPKGCALEGVYHTHTGRDARALKFSNLDIRAARELRVPSFLGVHVDTDVRVFDPASMTGHPDPSRMYAGVESPGQIIGETESSVVAADLKDPELRARADCPVTSAMAGASCAGTDDALSSPAGRASSLPRRKRRAR
jgi:hypothetical protein